MSTMEDIDSNMVREVDNIQTAELRFITASTPTTPGPTTPTRSAGFHTKVGSDDNELTLPPRPSSTPYPFSDDLDQAVTQSLPRNLEHTSWEATDKASLRHTLGSSSPSSDSRQLALFQQLPIEVHERVLDYLFGARNPVTAKVKTTREQAKGTKVLRNWANELRHSRRREVWELALVCEMWRSLIQERLYRHIKIKATKESVDEASSWFFDHQQLCNYVKHIELWFPVFQQKNLDTRTVRVPSVNINGNLGRSSMAQLDSLSILTFEIPNNNCTLEDAFRFIGTTFSGACVLSLEGGDRKKPPMVRHFANDSASPQALPVLPNITTLVCKGQWNIIRTKEDFENISMALPNLSEWQGVYARPKSKSYLCMASIFPNLAANITHLNLTMENEFRRENMCPTFFRKVAFELHICQEMAKMPALEHFGYTGRLCASFFDGMAALANPRTSRLKAVQITVKNICRPPQNWSDGSAITDPAFIHAFEALVLAAVKSLSRLTAIDLIHIKFIDLDSVLPSWNPYFLLKNNTCLGMWSDVIVDSLAKARPSAKWLECSEGAATFDAINWNDPVNLTKMRAKSLKVSSYLSLSKGITIS